MSSNIADLLHPLDISGTSSMKIFLNADLSTDLSANSFILNKITNTYSYTNRNTTNINNSISIKNDIFPYYLMQSNVIFNIGKNINTANGGSPFTIFAVFSYINIDKSVNSLICMSSTNSNVVDANTLRIGYDTEYGQDDFNSTPFTSFHIIENTNPLHGNNRTVFTRYNFSSVDNSGYAFTGDIIIMTIRVTAPNTNRPILTYFQNNLGISGASFPSEERKTTSRFFGNHQNILFGGSSCLKYYEFGLYYNDIGNTNAQKIQRYYMNKYYKPIFPTSLTIDVTNNIIRWSDGIYNSALFSTSSTTSNLRASISGGRIPDVYNVFIGTTQVAMNVLSSLRSVNNIYTQITISGSICNYNTSNNIYTLDVLNSSITGGKLSNLANGTYTIRIQGKNDKYGYTNEITKSITIANIDISNIVVIKKATTSSVYFDISFVPQNTSSNAKFYLDISYGTLFASVLFDTLQSSTNGFRKITGTIGGVIDILPNEQYIINIKVEDGKIKSGIPQTHRTFCFIPENLRITSTSNGRLAVSWDNIAIKENYSYEYIDDFNNNNNRSGNTTGTSLVFGADGSALGPLSFSYGPFSFRVRTINTTDLTGLWSPYYVFDGIDNSSGTYKIAIGRYFPLNDAKTMQFEVSHLYQNTAMFFRLTVSGFEDNSTTVMNSSINISGYSSSSQLIPYITDVCGKRFFTNVAEPNQLVRVRATDSATNDTSFQDKYTYSAQISSVTINKDFDNFSDIVLSWEHNDDNFNKSLLKYDISYSITGIAGYIADITSPYNARFFKLPNRIYNVNVLAVNGNGIANPINPYSTSITTYSIKPNILTISGISSTSISGYIRGIGTAPSDLSGLYIYYEIPPDSNSIIITNVSGYHLVTSSCISGTNYNFSISGLYPSTRYKIYGASRNISNEHNLSSSIQIDTLVDTTNFTYTTSVLTNQGTSTGLSLQIKVPPRIIKSYILDYSSNTVPTRTTIIQEGGSNSIFTLNNITYRNTYTFRIRTANFVDISFSHNAATVSGPAKLAIITNISYTPTSITFNVTDISSSVAAIFTARIRNTVTNVITSLTTTCTSSTSYPVTFNSLLTNVKYEVYVDTYPFNGSTLNTRTSSIFVTPTYMEKDRYTLDLSSTGTDTGPTADLYTLSGLTPGQNYDVYMAYIDQSGNRISDYSDIYTIQPYGDKPSNNYSDIQVATNSEGLFKPFIYPQSTDYAIYNISVIPDPIPADSNYNSLNDTYTKRFILYFSWTNFIKNSINDKIGIDIYFENNINRNFINVYKNIEFTNITSDTSGSIIVDLSYNSLKDIRDSTNTYILYTGTLTIYLYHMKKIDTVFLQNNASIAIYKNSSFNIL